MANFISCDWGTSAFRLRLVEYPSLTILKEITSGEGITNTYELMMKSRSERYPFYQATLAKGVTKLAGESGISLSGVPVIISGMATSSLGMMELDYKCLPVKTDGSDLLVHIENPSADFKYPMALISGVKSSDDVMRGEESLIIGSDLEETGNEQLIILPGTHSKHVTIKNGFITDIKTYMTGEIFELLVSKSILSKSVKSGSGFSATGQSWLQKGVCEGAENSFLNAIFHVRTKRLFNDISSEENYHYLSGLLIGSELSVLKDKSYEKVMLVSDNRFLPLYSAALHALHPGQKLYYQKAETALVKGQSFIYEKYFSNYE
ncbi:MAG: 2-dehydro-3-deoxygalactonokinase [Ginsengibacter sp.]